MSVIQELSNEALEIKRNITQVARRGDITWQQREELINLVNQDVEQKLNLARNLLHDWTGSYDSDTWAA